MARLSKRLSRIEEPTTAAASLGVALLVLLAAYAYAVALSTPVTMALVAAAALVGIAGTGLLYAWRAVTGASSE